MGFGMCQCVLSLIICSALFTSSGAEDDITSCCETEDGCCGPDWGLHCCNFIARICCYGDERVHALHHHNHHRHWHWNRHYSCSQYNSVHSTCPTEFPI
ncbi:hypothetical protein C0J52_23720 [Blattella germanica]|nr:hypothetical protein C0J52_23720 [Blattella germanica]